MVHFECLEVKHPLLLFPSGVNCREPFTLHAGKGNAASGLLKKVKIHFAKIFLMYF